MRARFDSPLPGDFVIRQEVDSSGIRAAVVFSVTHWPVTDSTYGGPYQSYGYALRKAREFAAPARARVWYQVSARGTELLDVTED